MDITYEEWQTALDWMEDQDVEDPYMLTKGVLGSCPPEPAPATWRSIGVTEVKMGVGDKDVWVGIPGIAHELLTANEADDMAVALKEHARFARAAEKQDAHEKVAQDIQVGDRVFYDDEKGLVVLATVIHIVDAPGRDTVKIKYDDGSYPYKVRWVDPKTLEKI